MGGGSALIPNKETGDPAGDRIARLAKQSFRRDYLPLPVLLAAVLGVLFFGVAFLVECFLVVFLVVSVLVLVCAPLAGGVAGACAANVRGIVATAKAIAKMIFFMVPFLPRGLCPLTIPSCCRSPENSIACAG